MAKVSIILTSYNHDNYLREAIDSVLAQTYTDFELFIWDDVSSDNSWEIINQYVDPRIKPYRNDEQKTAVHGANKVIFELSTGEYVAIHHSDDVWESAKLEKQVAYLDEHPDIAAVFTWAQVIDERGEKIDNDWFTAENQSRWEWLRELFQKKNRLNHPSVLIRKSAYLKVGGYRHSAAQSADADMWSRILLFFPIHVIPEKLTKHRLFSDRSNSSGVRHETTVRLRNEWPHLLENFLVLSPEDCFKVFPQLEHYKRPHGGNIKFLMAMACLRESQQKDAWQLGLRWLYEIVNDKVQSEKINDLYGFTYLDLIELSKNHDVYGTTTDAVIAELRQKLQAAENQLQAVINSRSWALTKPLRYLMNKIAPRN